MNMVLLLCSVLLARDNRDCTVLEFSQPAVGIAAVDLIGDGQREFLLARENGLFLRSLDPSEEEVLLIERTSPTSTLVWSVVSGEAEDQLYVLSDGQRILRLVKGAAEPEVLLEELRVQMPAGIYSMPFVRDLLRNGQMDLLLPSAKGLQVYYSNEDQLAEGPLMEFESNRSWHLDEAIDAPLNREYRQRFTLSNFSMQDHNNDQRLDFVVQDENRVRFYFSGSNGTLPKTPSFTLDLEELRNSLPKWQEGKLDTSNLLRALESTVTHDVRDYDGDGWSDLLIRIGPKVSLYGGGPEGIDRSRARQVLKTSGNLLATFAFDENEDGALDLGLLTIGDLSLAQILLWVVVGGEIEFDLYVYYQKEPLSFARKPSSRRALQVDFPSLATIGDDMEDSGEEVMKQLRHMPFAINWTGDGQSNDVVLPTEQRLLVFSNVSGTLDMTSPQVAWRSVVERFDRQSEGKQELDIELTEFMEWAPITGGALRARLREREPKDILQLPSEHTDQETYTAHGVDLNRDGKDEVIAVFEGTSPGEFVSLAIWGLR